MVRISENLIRKRSEHNNCEISTLEEVSLHQQDIERIEYLDKWCRDLKILYLQSNLIPKIENVNRLKKLEYLNLALNNVERVENLEGCECLNKLDLTVNFVGELTSIESLKDLYHLRELFLTGNPCTEYEGYRQYVLGTLPQLQYLDGTEIGKAERIKALQNYAITRAQIIQQQGEYKKKREKQKKEAAEKEEKEKMKDELKKDKKAGFDGRWYTDMNKEAQEEKKIEEKAEEEEDKEFWNEKVDFTPESRMAVHKQMQKEKDKNKPKEATVQKAPRRLFNDEGRPLNVNEAKIDFTLTEDDTNNIILDLAIFKHMDTSLLDCDVQPTYVRVTVKDKVFQLCLPEEVKSDSSVAKRSQTTGHLVIYMPKLCTDGSIISTLPKAKVDPSFKKTVPRKIDKSNTERLEVEPSAHKGVDISNIVKDKKDIVPPLGSKKTVKKTERPNSEDFIDDPDVPPLI
ncbi:hypothetical protein LOTGIDRAFT_222768 [Lottia gigantea]|uniref:Dynein axonemal assembly factor 11-like CS domain-containing protein n=1 Tax=Lottia gigantea TaxID=225164 RepID=V3ZR69_LOTGI|nr:hypothetical protein LOTGIDRAFT_222768 [Lottia gigantea]ESO83361.1 hypothetical protein LOTGIDRAFT_222768 [Lottia gigantea]